MLFLPLILCFFIDLFEEIWVSLACLVARVDKWYKFAYTLSDKKMSDLFFVGLNYSSDKIFVTSKRFCHFCLTKDFVHSSFLLDMTYIIASVYTFRQKFNLAKYFVGQTFHRTKLFVGHDFRHFHPKYFATFDRHLFLR